MVLMNHGMFSFGATARQSYERMIALVSRAEAFLEGVAPRERGRMRQPGMSRSSRETNGSSGSACEDDARFAARRNLGGRRLSHDRADARRAEVSRVRPPRATFPSVAQQGPATPDHVIRTKRVPMIGRDVRAYAHAYRRYFERNAPLAKEPKTMLDPAPRMVLDPELGFCAIGRTAKDARIVHDLYAHTIDVILRATALGGYRALPEKDIFDVEYWDLEQAKLRKAGKPPAFTGEVALVTGAASGIGKACVEAFLARGAAVVALDVNPAVERCSAAARRLPRASMRRRVGRRRSTRRSSRRARPSAGSTCSC